MTLAEIIRAIDSKKRVQKEELQVKAVFDYTLANLIGKSVARIYNSANTMPEINTVYPTLFDSKEIEEKRQEKLDELSAARFRQFVQCHNDKLKKEVAK